MAEQWVRARERPCWLFLRAHCRKPATKSVRIGDHAIHYCDTRGHKPRRKSKSA